MRFNYKKLNHVSSIFFFFLFFNVNISAQCPDVELIDLRGVPGYAQMDDINICGPADTISLIIYTGDPGTIIGFELELSLPDGLEYGGWEYSEYNGTSIINSDSNPSCPAFVVDGFDGDSLVVVNIGVEANCEIDINELLHIDYNYDFKFLDTLNVLNCCSGTYTPSLEYNSSINIPVLNVLSGLSPAEVELTSVGAPFCQDIQISQDGLSSFLDSFTVEIVGLDFSSGLLLNSITANSTENVPFIFDASTMTTSAIIKEEMFLGNNLANPADQQFNTNEILSLTVCYQLDACPSTADLPFVYNAYYGCNEEICELSGQTSYLRIRPTGSSDPTATTTLVSSPFVCGADGEISVTVTNPGTDTDQNKYTDISIGFETCEVANMEITDVKVNGMSLPAISYGWIGDDLNIDFSQLNFDPDGMGGIEDIDNDGFFDDLRGGNAVEVSISVGVACGIGSPDPASDVCPSNNCNFSQFYVEGKTNCGNGFKKYPDVLGGFDIVYGPTAISNPNAYNIPISDPMLTGYDFERFGDLGSSGSPNPTSSAQEIEFCYDFASQNFNTCSSSEIYLNVLFSGTEGYIYDMEITSAELSEDGGATYTTTANIATDITWTAISDSERNLKIDLGSDAANICYKYTILMDSVWCAVPSYWFGAQQVIEKCNDVDCGVGGCELVRACKSATFYGNGEHWDCECIITGNVRELYRKNYGYTDASLTTQVTREMVSADDQRRFLPCDTMVIDYYHIITDAYTLTLPMERLNFTLVARGNSNSPENIANVFLAFNHKYKKLIEVSVNKVGIPYAGRQVLDFSTLDCDGSITHDYSHVPWGDGDGTNYSKYASGNSSSDYNDGNVIRLALENDCYSGGGGDCIDDFLSTTNYEAGDTINIKMEVALMKNPYREALIAMGEPVGASNNQFVANQTNIYIQDEDNCNLILGVDCGADIPWFGTCPGTVSTLSNVDLNACGGAIEHTFYLDSELPIDGGGTWFNDEFRPIYHIFDIDDPIFTPMAYCGNGEVINYVNGVPVSMPISPKGVDNMFCIPVDGYDEVCGVESGNTGTLIWNPNEAGASALGVGMLTKDSLKIKYDFCLLCPEAISASDYNMIYDYGYDCGESISTPYKCNGEPLCVAYGEPGNNNNTFYAMEILGENLDSLFYYNDRLGPNVTINDNRPTVQNVTSNLGVGAGSLIASASPGVSQEIQPIDICNPDPSTIAQGVAATVKIPSSVNLVNVYSDAGGTTVLTNTLIADDGTYKIYSIDLGTTTLAAGGTCINIFVGTTLQYCPLIGEVPANICVGAISGCSPLEIRVALASADGCGASEVCYAYTTGEVGIQTEWFDMPSNPQLCDEITFNVLVKNVKELTVVDLITSFEIPNGITIDPSSWEVAYPGGPTSLGTWTSVPQPDQIVGNKYTYTDDAIWSIPTGTPIHSTGLEGVSIANTTADSNKVAFRFKATSMCDEFLSGSKLLTETTAANPCYDGRVTSGAKESTGVIVNGANPAQNAQLLIIADPEELNCQATNNTFGITAINTSSYPTADSVITCVTIPDGLDYTPNSLKVVQPAGYTIANVQSTVIGNNLELCFVSPKIGVSQSMKLTLDAAIDDTFSCGDVRLGVDIKSVIESANCSSGPACDVFVQNSINSSINIEIKPPFIAEDWNVYSECASGEDVSLYYKFTINHNGPDASNQAYTANFYQDIDGDLLINPNIDELLITDNGTFSVNDGSSITLSGNVVIAQEEACPIMMEIVYNTICTCDREEKLLEDIKLRSLSEYTEPIAMCPGDCFTVDVCDFVQVGADSIVGATGVVYTPDLEWSLRNTYSIPHDSTQSPIKKGPPIDFVLYETLTDNQASESVNRRGGLLFPEQSTGDEAYLKATFPNPVNVERFYLAGGLVSGWTNMTGLAVYGSRTTLLEYSLDGGNTWIDSGLSDKHPDNNTGVFEYILPIPIVARHWRFTSLGMLNWGTSEFRFEGDPLPFEGNGPVARSGNTVNICLPENVGIEIPMEVVFDAGFGECSNLQTLEIWNIGNNRISLGNDLVVCGDECFDLDVDLIGDGTLENTTITWTPTTGMDDPTSLNPEICGLTTDVTYIAEVTFPGGCIKKDTIEVDHRTVPNFPTAQGINFCVGYEDATLTTNNGYPEYKWYQILGGNEILIATTSTNSYVTNMGGTFRSKAFDGVDFCQVEADEFIVVEENCEDWGDLPDGTAGVGVSDYQTDSTNLGPNHQIIDGLYIGTGVDVEPNGQSSVDALGDGADEDGFTFSSTLDLIPGGILNIPIDVTNTTGEIAHYEVWIDWNGDGDFNDPNEMVADFSDDGAGDFGVSYFTLNIPDDVITNQLFGFRARLSHTDNMTPYGPVDAGEVEDYLIGVECSPEVCLPLGITIDKG